MHRPAAFLSMVLMLGLLLTQWLGYAHAIAHADGRSEAVPIEIAKAGVVDHHKSASACAAFDEATLGAGLHSPAITLFAASAASFAPLGLTPVGHAPAFFAHFSSRAPPLTA
ncbi:MAG: hypothetical protein FJY60_05650 [Betaproteobacteria bacterium]|nr:hypothetical protein [Betaproteobacteria bacterium]